MNGRFQRGGFTLVELVVVLLVIGIVTHLAVRELGAFRASRLVSAADRQLQEIRTASAAFVADLGRLPRAMVETNEHGEAIYTLSELWRRPTDLPAPTVSNVAAGAFVSTGWRGPYLQLAIGRERLTDPWGNALEVPVNDADRAPERLVVSNATVWAVRHFGERTRPEAMREVTLVPIGGLTHDLVVGVWSERLGGMARCTVTSPYDGGVSNQSQMVALGTQAKFSGLTPGVKTLVVTCGETMAVRSVAVGRDQPSIVEVRLP